MAHGSGRLSLAAASIAAALATVLIGCSSNAAEQGPDNSSAETAADGASETTSADTTQATGDTTGDTAAIPSDVCALFDDATVTALLGEAVVGEATPSGGCQFPGGTAASLYPTIEISEDFEGAGGIAGAQAGAEAVLGTTATPLTVGGYTGYVINGNMQGFSSGQGAVAAKNLIVTVTVSGPDAAVNTPVITTLLELAVAGL